MEGVAARLGPEEVSDHPHALQAGILDPRGLGGTNVDVSPGDRDVTRGVDDLGGRDFRVRLGDRIPRIPAPRGEIPLCGRADPVFVSLGPGGIDPGAVPSGLRGSLDVQDTLPAHPYAPILSELRPVDHPP